MSEDLIAGKRYPRGMRRHGFLAGEDKKGFRSYYDLGKVLRNSSLEEYNKKVAEIKKMGQKSL